MSVCGEKKKEETKKRNTHTHIYIFTLEKNSLKVWLEENQFDVLREVKLERLTLGFQDKCVLCGFSGRMDWQITLHDGSSGLVCADCGCKLADKIREGE